MTTATVENLRTDRAALLAELRRAGADVTRPGAIRCPFHDDKHPSGSVHQDPAGVWRFKCHGCGEGGDVFDLRAKASGRAVADELKAASESDNSRPQRLASNTSTTPARVFASIDDLRRSDSRITEVYCYPDKANVELVVLRMREADGRKTFRQARPVTGGFAYGAPPQPWPILNAAAVKSTEQVVVVEGEKDVVTLTKLNIAATTSPGGAGKSHCTDWSPLAGNTVYLWPDADGPDPKTGQRTGIRHMRQVAQQLQALDPPARVLWVDPDKLGLSGGQDVSDLLDQHVDFDDAGKAALIHEIIDKAESMGPSAGVRSLIEDAISGRRRNVPFPWTETTRWSRALLPGTVTLLVAPAGATKSFWLMQAAAHWHEYGERPAVLMLEDGRDFHLRRALAQRAGIGDLTNDEWCKSHPERARQAQQEHAAWLDAFGSCIHTLQSDGQPTFDAIGDWVEAQAMAGKQIIVVDPLSIAEVKRDQYIEDQKFIARVKRTCEQFGCRVLLVMHPVKHAKTRTLDDVAGGAAYVRLAHTVLWLEFHEQAETVTLRDPLMNYKVDAEINRTLHILKARNACGTGWSIGFEFDGRSLNFEEMGVALK